MQNVTNGTKIAPFLSNVQIIKEPFMEYIEIGVVLYLSVLVIIARTNSKKVARQMKKLSVDR